MKKKGILERLKEGPVLGDGGYLLELEKRGWVRPGPFTPEVAIVYPDALRELHIEFRNAGAEVLQALTFYASRDKLATVGLEDRVEDINRSAVRIAKEVAGDDCLVAGNLSLTWMYEPNSATAADRVRVVDLRDRRRGERLARDRDERVEADVLADHRLELVVRGRRDLVDELAELLDVDVRQEVWPRGEQLAELQVGGAELLERAPELDGALTSGRAVADDAHLAQDAKQAVSPCGARDLERAPRALEPYAHSRFLSAAATR